MKNLFIVSLLILLSNFCNGQLDRKEEFLNDFLKSDTTKDTLACRYSKYPAFPYPEAIHESFDQYLDSEKINRMLKLATDTVWLLWDSSKVKGVKFVSGDVLNIISGGPCYLEHKMGDLSKDKDTELARRYIDRKKVMDKYHNPKGVYEYDIPVLDDSGQYAIFVKEFYCCGLFCIDRYCYLYQKINGHWNLVKEGSVGYYN
jgi:hypothetical protein